MTSKGRFPVPDQIKISKNHPVNDESLILRADSVIESAYNSDKGDEWVENEDFITPGILSPPQSEASYVDLYSNSDKESNLLTTLQNSRRGSDTHSRKGSIPSVMSKGQSDKGLKNLDSEPLDSIRKDSRLEFDMTDFTPMEGDSALELKAGETERDDKEPSKEHALRTRHTVKLPFVDFSNMKVEQVELIFQKYCEKFGVTPIKIYSYLVQGRSLILHSYKLNKGVARALALVLPFFTKLEEISLSDNTLEDESLAEIVSAIKLCPNFRNLKILNNKPRKLFMETLYNSIYHKSRFLKVLNLKGCTTVTGQFPMLMKILQRLLELESLNLSDIKLNISAIQQLSNYIKDNDTLTKLSLSNCNIVTSKALTLLRALFKNDSICFLDLSYNNFSSEKSAIAS